MADASAAKTNGHAANGNGTAAAGKKYNVEIQKQAGSQGKPDKGHHDGEMDRLKKEIDKVQGEVVSPGGRSKYAQGF